MRFLNWRQVDLLMFSSNSSSKSNFRRVFLFLRRKFDFEDDLEENTRRPKLSAVGKSPCVYIRRSDLLQGKNPYVVQQHFCPQQHFCQLRASQQSAECIREINSSEKQMGGHSGVCPWPRLCFSSTSYSASSSISLDLI